MSQWKNRFTVRRQGELDHACGAYSVVNAAVALGALDDDGDGLRTTLARLRRADPAAFADITSRVLQVGTWERHLKKLGAAAGVTVTRVSKPTFGNFVHHEDRPSFHIALVRVDFSDPAVKSANRGSPFSCLHFVVVLDVAEDAVIVADPHPWRARLQRVPRRTFQSWLRAARRGKRPWVGRITKA